MIVSSFTPDIIIIVVVWLSSVMDSSVSSILDAVAHNWQEKKDERLNSGSNLSACCVTHYLRKLWNWTAGKSFI
jgi:hypothetical protein